MTVVTFENVEDVVPERDHARALRMLTHCAKINPYWRNHPTRTARCEWFVMVFPGGGVTTGTRPVNGGVGVLESLSV